MGWRVHHVHDDPAGVPVALRRLVIYRRAQRNLSVKPKANRRSRSALDNLRASGGDARGGRHWQPDAAPGDRPGPVSSSVGDRAAHVKPLLAQEKSAPRDWSGRADLRHYRRQRRWRGPAGRWSATATRLPANITAGQMDTWSRLAALSLRAGAGVMCPGPPPTMAKMRSVQRTVRRK